MKRAAVYLLSSGLLGVSLCHANPHPVRVDGQSNCIECHRNRASGDYVHAAVKAGCVSCHNVEDRDDASYISVQPKESNSCFECHKPVPAHHPHFPYVSGMCVRCHDPHASRFPGLLRAKVNDLCLDCHLQSQAKHQSRYVPTIELTQDHRLGHPYARHPVSGLQDPLTGGEISCLSCHLPHGGNKLHQLKMGSEIPEDALNQSTETRDMCEKCHMKLWGVDGIAGGNKHKKKPSR